MARNGDGGIGQIDEFPVQLIEAASAGNRWLRGKRNVKLFEIGLANGRYLGPGAFAAFAVCLGTRFVDFVVVG